MYIIETVTETIEHVVSPKELAAAFESVFDRMGHVVDSGLEKAEFLTPNFQKDVGVKSGEKIEDRPYYLLVRDNRGGGPAYSLSLQVPGSESSNPDPRSLRTKAIKNWDMSDPLKMSVFNIVTHPEIEPRSGAIDRFYSRRYAQRSPLGKLAARAFGFDKPHQ